jgi:multimeric flavodoxin WrbA
MNILGISGSPREKGNSEILLEYALKPFKENGWTIETPITHLRGIFRYPSLCDPLFY